jgi:hypothetical protein
MKRRYVTVQVLLACKSKPAPIKKDIHAELAETIAEHKRLVRQWEQKFLQQQKRFELIIQDQQAA